VRSPEGEILVLKSDPVTFATDSIGRYAVHVNVNDVLTAGATPRWLLASIFLPPETHGMRVRQILREVHETTRELGLALCGGHTEITDAVTRPVVSAHVIATVSAERLITKQGMMEGDHILMTKGIALEGTCILAREIPQILSERGVSSSTLERAKSFLTDPGISIAAEARLAARTPGVSAMHDVTEGGLATAVAELSAAGRHRLRVYLDRISILDETREVCRALEIDPMGLIGSGCLLITCRRAVSPSLQGALEEARISASHIGEVLDGGTGVEALAREGGSPRAWPTFDADEIAVALERAAASRPGKTPDSTEKP
jgi:hydrogenase maturation factor